jgi:hypothetical protein
MPDGAEARVKWAAGYAQQIEGRHRGAEEGGLPADVPAV